jgi:2'-hydroxyisoflavone reductase
MEILVLGGTRFLGRAIVEAALGRGHQVTLFNRGETNPHLFPGLETIKGDRTADVSGLAGREFDAAIDVAAMLPEHVEKTVGALRGDVAKYVFISTVSVYANHDITQKEGNAVLELREGMDEAEAYGANKAACESVVTGDFGRRSLIIRPGLIVGPHDPTDRFAYWPRRVARGGRVLAPGGPAHPAQFIDVRDLGSWVVHAVEHGLSGIYNATGEPSTLGVLLDACQEILAAHTAELVWVSDELLLGAGVEPWMGIPLWTAAEDWGSASDVDIRRALGAGLSFRPLIDTVRDTLVWDLARGGPDAGSEGLSAEREAELLTALAGG